jgi:hypothetical protein
MDVEGGIERGQDFPDAIKKALTKCNVLIVMIGRNWLTCTDDQGRRRLDNSADWVRNEICQAIKREIRIIPVLVDGIRMPSSDQLPAVIAEFSNRQSIDIRSASWSQDVKSLVSSLRKDVPINRRTVVLSLTCLIIIVASAIRFYPTNEIVLEKIWGDGQTLGKDFGKEFSVKAKTLNGKPAVGIKVAWTTSFCPNAYIGETDKEGISKATILCNVHRPPGKYEQKAVPVRSESIGLTDAQNTKALGPSVSFSFISE